MPAFPRNQAFASTLFSFFLSFFTHSSFHWFQAVKTPVVCRVDHSLLIEHEKSPFFLLSLNSAFKNFLNPSSCQCVVKVPLCFVSVLTDLPPSSPSIRYVLYRSVVSWKAALMRAASVWPFVRKGGHTIWISLRNRFFLLLYTHINVEFLYFILIFF